MERSVVQGVNVRDGVGVEGVWVAAMHLCMHFHMARCGAGDARGRCSDLLSITVGGGGDGALFTSSFFSVDTVFDPVGARTGGMIVGHALVSFEPE